MEDIFEKIFSRVQQMSVAEFKTELARYKDDELVIALSEMEGVIAKQCDRLTIKHVPWYLQPEALSPLTIDEFQDWIAVIKAANDERFALAA